MKFIVTYVGGGAKAFPLGNLAELAQAKEALRSARQKTAQVYRGNPHDPSTWHHEGRLTAAPPKKSNTARRPARSAGRKTNAPRKPTARKVKWSVKQGGHTLIGGHAPSEAKARDAASNAARTRRVRDAAREAAMRSPLWEEGFHLNVNGLTRYPLSRRSEHLRRVWS